MSFVSATSMNGSSSARGLMMQQHATRSFHPVANDGFIPEPGCTLNTEYDRFQTGADHLSFDKMYEMDDMLGNGSFGTVFRCHHKLDWDRTTPYAVKIVEKEKLREKNADSVRREISILTELRSHNLENVIQLIDFLQDADKFFIVLQFARGGDLCTHLSQRINYTEYDAREVAKVLIKTIGAIQRLRIVHRDLKPQNLLLRYPNDHLSVMLADFGFARTVPPDAWCTSICGTPAFIAPEIVLRQPYDMSVDMWSIGCLIYMLLGGYPPFSGSNHAELFCKIRVGDFVFHDTVFKRVSVAAKNFITGLLTVNPGNRYTVQQALESDWFVRETRERLQRTDLSRTTSAGNKSQIARRRWKAAITVIKWAAMQKFWDPDKVTFSQQLDVWDGQSVDTRNRFDRTEDSTWENDDRAELSRMESEHVPSSPMKRIQVHCARFADVYSVKRPLRSGSTATVMECVHIHSGETFVVKVIPRQGLNSTSDDENAMSEVAAMMSLSGNKYCVQLLDFYEEKDAFYLVMAYMAGGDVFDQIVKLKSYTEKDARDLTKSLLVAIRSIHKAGIAHRDIKPQNMLLRVKNNQTRMKLGDFGFARRVHTPNSLTSRLGTPTYVAPEILKNIPHDQRVDLWSCGVVIFILLVGYPPFMEDNQALMFDQIRRGDWAFVEEDWKDISIDAKRLIFGLLQVDPNERLSVDEALQSPWFQTDALSLSSNTLGSSVASIRAIRKKLRGTPTTVLVNSFNNLAIHSNVPTRAQPMTTVESEDSMSL